MKSRIAVVVGVLVTLGFFGSVAQATNTDPNEDHKVTICHRTGSATNPYVEITVDIASSGLVKGGHTNHEQVGNGAGGDIIPAYEAFAKVKGEWVAFSFPGKGDQSLLENGCKLPEGTVDVCPNIDGVQTEVPFDFLLDQNGDCVKQPASEPTPPPLGHHGKRPKPPGKGKPFTPKELALTGITSRQIGLLAAAGILAAIGGGSLYLTRKEREEE